MCGIAGILSNNPAEARGAVERMCRAMAARGPDGAGITLLSLGNAGGTLALGHRRLAVLDPSSAGHQPMRDPARGTVIVFNGFIANVAELRARLVQAGERITSQCDTEVVLKAYGRYGPACVRLLRGMFAIAIWDPRDETLFLARDPFGIKPLYYAQRGGRLLFASQVKALLASGLVPPELSSEGLETFLAFGGVREPLTAIAGVYALPAGHTVVVRRGRLHVARYWSAQGLRSAECRAMSDEWSSAAYPSAHRSALIAQYSSLSTQHSPGGEALRALLDETVAGYLTSDVPLGVLLSGGLDSSVLALLATGRSGHSPLRTGVSLVDAASAADEAERAAMEVVARAAGINHVVAPLHWSEVEQWLPRMFVAMDQPTFDGVNTYAVARAAAASGLKVVLSGLGADELFDGYGLSRRAEALMRARRLAEWVGAPPRMRALAACLMPGRKGEKARAYLAGQLPADAAFELLRRLFLPEEVDRLRRRRPSAPKSAERRVLSDAWSSAARLRTSSLIALRSALSTDPGVGGHSSLLDLEGYTRDVLLRDTDCMSMAHGVEVRVPFLDQAVVEFVLRLPAGLRQAPGKRLLVEAVRDLLPPAVLARRKRGFVLPIERWLRGPLRWKVEATLRSPPGALAELLNENEMARVWHRFLAGRASWHGVWALYALCRWVASLSGEAE